MCDGLTTDVDVERQIEDEKLQKDGENNGDNESMHHVDTSDSDSHQQVYTRLGYVYT